MSAHTVRRTRGLQFLHIANGEGQQVEQPGRSYKWVSHGSSFSCLTALPETPGQVGKPCSGNGITATRIGGHRCRGSICRQKLVGMGGVKHFPLPLTDALFQVPAALTFILSWQMQMECLQLRDFWCNALNSRGNFCLWKRILFDLSFFPFPFCSSLPSRSS